MRRAVLASLICAACNGPAIGPSPNHSEGPTDPSPQFLSVTERVGLSEYAAWTGEHAEVHGPGGVFADLNRDGFPELVLVTKEGEETFLYENVPDASEGRRFERRPLSDQTPGSTGAVAADYDNDGDLDVYVTNIGPNILYKNLWVETGELRFEDATASTDPTPDEADDQHGVAFAEHEGEPLLDSLTAAWADVNRDGYADLYVGSHLLYIGERDTLYLSRGDGTFEDVTPETGVTGWETPEGADTDGEQTFSSTNAVTFADLNNDQWPDLFVTNKNKTPNDTDMLYVNRGVDEHGTWQGFKVKTYDLPEPLGPEATLAMGIAVIDHDADGDLDIYISDSADSPLWENQWADTGELSLKLATGYAAPWGWGTQWKDFSNDGWPDLHVATSIDYTDRFYPHTATGPDEQAEAFGLDQQLSCRGSISADYNRDGWLDLFVTNLRGPSTLFENRGAGQSHWLELALEGNPASKRRFKSTRDALGARVTVSADTDGTGTKRHLRRDVTSGDSNSASTSSLVLHFGLGTAKNVSVEVAWPSGAATELDSVAVDQQLVISEP